MRELYELRLQCPSGFMGRRPGTLVYVLSAAASEPQGQLRSCDRGCMATEESNINDVTIHRKTWKSSRKTWKAPALVNGTLGQIPPNLERKNQDICLEELG